MDTERAGLPIRAFADAAALDANPAARSRPTSRPSC